MGQKSHKKNINNNRKENIKKAKNKIFSKKVYGLVKKIPIGKVTTYKELGKKLNTKSYRAIGQILKKNPYSPNVPCHRVINSNGTIGGYNGIKNNPEKIKMLKKEGIKIKNNKIDLKKYLANSFN